MTRLSEALPKEGSDTLALAGVLTLWAALVTVALSWIAVYGHNIPLYEDWFMVRPLLGEEPSLYEWLWAQNNEHRLPLQRAVYLLLLKASGGDFRTGMIANILIIAGLCLTMIFTARRVRGGHTRLADAFFPLVLLHLGHWENMGWGWSLQFVISTALICLWLLIIVGARWPLAPEIAVIAGLTLVLLPISGANGVLSVPFAALWLAAGTLLYRSEATGRWVTSFQGACIVASITLAGVYFIGFERTL